MASNDFKIFTASKLTCLKSEANLVSFMTGKDWNYQGKYVLTEALLDFCILCSQMQNYSDTNLSVTQLYYSLIIYMM